MCGYRVVAHDGVLGRRQGRPAISPRQRAIIYQRAKGLLDKRPFGTQYDVYASLYEWMHHSIAPKPAAF